jgi:hypothetical protein
MAFVGSIVGSKGVPSVTLLEIAGAVAGFHLWTFRHSGHCNRYVMLGNDAKMIVAALSPVETELLPSGHQIIMSATHCPHRIANHFISIIARESICVEALHC